MSRLSVPLFWKGSGNFVDACQTPKSLVSKTSFESKNFASDVHSSLLENTGAQIVDSQMMTSKKSGENVIVLSDDEVEPRALHHKAILSDSEMVHYMSDGNTLSSGSGKSTRDADPTKQNVSCIKTPKDLAESFHGKASSIDFSQSSLKRNSGNSPDQRVATSFANSKGLDTGGREVSSKSQDNINLTTISEEDVNATVLNKDCGIVAPKKASALSTTSDQRISDIIRDAEEDPLETAMKSVGRTQLHVAKPSSVLRRQVIQLKTPFENKSGRLNGFEHNLKRFKPPSLNDWYKSILEIDYFAIVGLSSTRKDEKQAVRKLKEVPVFFQSAEQYVEIFRPLVLEEFKAQLHNLFVEMSSWEEMLSGRLSVMSVERVDDFHLVRFVHDDSESAASRSFSENDLVLLTKDLPQKSSQDVHMVGKVTCELCHCHHMMKLFRSL